MPVKRLSIPIFDLTHIYTTEKDFPPLSDFESKVLYPALIVPAKETNSIKSKLGNLVLKKARTRNVCPVEETEAVEGIDYRQERKIVLVRALPSDNKRKPTGDEAVEPKSHEDNEENADSKETFDDIFNNPTLLSLLQSANDNNTIRKDIMEMKLTYEDYTVDQTLSQLLPIEYVSKQEIPSAFETAGHLAHLNLPDHMIPYKYIIGKVIFDKNQPRIRTVVNKIGTIQNAYRTFPMEILAGYKGEDVFEVQIREGGCVFHLNFAQVYWNSRLQFEHGRLVECIASNLRKKRSQANVRDDGDKKKMHLNSTVTTDMSVLSSTQSPLIVADVMAGVGPFAIPLASLYENIVVHANDLNPKSFEYLQKNATVNKCVSQLKSSNLDGRAFIHALNKERVKVRHFIMNLPASAIEFLDAFRGWSVDLDEDARPMVHVYCFETKNEEESRRNAIQRCKAALGCALEENKGIANGVAGDREADVSIHIVRDVAPNKNMLCVSFLLPCAVANLEPISLNGSACLSRCLGETREENKGECQPNIKRAKHLNLSEN